jgi:hypothetical protein
MTYPGFERRANLRADVPATAVWVRAGTEMAEFAVANLSASGALLIGSSELSRGDTVLLRLEAPGCTPVRVHARVVRGGDGDGVNALAVEFRHRSPDTEDAIQDAVLLALEAAAGYENPKSGVRRRAPEARAATRSRSQG